MRDNHERVRSLNTKKLVFYAFCLALGLVFSYIEAVLPFSIGIPGAKVGLPNIITVILLLTVGIRPAIAISVMRIVLSGFMFGNMFAIVYSFAGFLFSIAVMQLLRLSRRFGIIGISTAGGAAHNMGQLTAAVMVAGRYVISYFPALLIAGTVAGIVVGAVGGAVISRIYPLIAKILN